MSQAAPSQPDLTGVKGRVWKRSGGVRHRTQGKLRGKLKDIGWKSVDRNSAGTEELPAFSESDWCPRHRSKDICLQYSSVGLNSA